MSLDQIHSRDFAAALNTTFQCHASAGVLVPLELIEVQEKNYSPASDQFSLFLQGPLRPLLPQGIYTLAHETLGDLDLFLVPVGIVDGGTRYEIVFNRLRRAQPAHADR